MTGAAVDDFEQPVPDYAQAGTAASGAELIVHLDGFEGPIDLLLTLARDQKVDLTKISILGLAGPVQSDQRLPSDPEQVRKDDISTQIST